MSNPLQLRPLTLDHVDDVVAIDQRAFGKSGWSRRYFVGEITDSPISIFYFLSDRDTGPLGYFGTWVIVEQLQLCTFAVDPSLHGQGLGDVLLNCVFRLSQRLECQTIQLEVRESNLSARRLYRSRGFAEDAVRRNFYSNPPEDGVLMSRDTPASLRTSFRESTAHRWPDGIELDWDDRAGRHFEHWAAR